MSIFIVCDRCDFGAKYDIVSEPSADATNIVVRFVAPAGWVELRNVQLCPLCDAMLNEWLKPLPLKEKI